MGSQAFIMAVMVTVVGNEAGFLNPMTGIMQILNLKTILVSWFLALI